MRPERRNGGAAQAAPLAVATSPQLETNLPMTFVKAAIASVAAIAGAYEAFLSMFIGRPTVLVWLLAPLVWPVSWLLNGPTGKFRLAYLLLCALVIATNAALYAFLSWAVLGLLLRRTSQRKI